MQEKKRGPLSTAQGRARTHEATKPLKGPGNARVGADLYQYILFCQHEHVKVPRLVKGAVHEGQKHLVHNVRAVLAGVTPVLFAQVDVVVAIQQLKTTAALHSLQRALLQYNMHYRLWGQFLTRWGWLFFFLFSERRGRAGKKKKKKKTVPA